MDMAFVLDSQPIDWVYNHHQMIVQDSLYVDLDSYVDLGTYVGMGIFVPEDIRAVFEDIQAVVDMEMIVAGMVMNEVDSLHLLVDNHVQMDIVFVGYTMGGWDLVFLIPTNKTMAY